MRLKILYSILIFSSFYFYGQNDSVKANKFSVYISPSQIFFGDIPLGIEHKLHKRLDHEIYFQFKISGPIFNIYNFDKGFGLKYFLKYNLLKKTKNYLTLNLGYSYRNVYFENKKELTPFYKSENSDFHLLLTQA